MVDTRRDPLAVAAPPRDPDGLTAEQLTERLRAAIQRESYLDLTGQLYEAHRHIRRLTVTNGILQRQQEADRVENRRLKAKNTQLQRRLDTRDAANHRALLGETPTAVLLAELGRRAAELPAMPGDGQRRCTCPPDHDHDWRGEQRADGQPGACDLCECVIDTP